MIKNDCVVLERRQIQILLFLCPKACAVRSCYSPSPVYCTISAIGSAVILVFVLSSLVRNIEPIVGANAAMLSRTSIFGKQERMFVLNVMCDQE